MTFDEPYDRDRHTLHTREAYDRLAPVWSAATDDGPYNGGLERPALRALVPIPLRGSTVLDAGCGAGAQCEWLLDSGADVFGVDLSPRMVEEAASRCGGRGRFIVANLAEPLPLEPESLDGITCSLTLHYLRDWMVPLRSFATALRAGGWVVLSVDHPAAPPLQGQRGNYFDTELVRDTWTKNGVEVTQHFWRRPLETAMAAFTDAGFVVDGIAEPRPSPEALDRWPVLASTSDSPTFIVYRLVKRQSTSG